MFCYTSQQELKNRKKCEEIVCLLTNLPWFQGARPDHVQVESSCCCFLRELVRFVRPRELVSFDPRHVTRSPPIGKRIWVGGVTMYFVVYFKNEDMAFHCCLFFNLFWDKRAHCCCTFPGWSLDTVAKPAGFHINTTRSQVMCCNVNLIRTSPCLTPHPPPHPRPVTSLSPSSFPVLPTAVTPFRLEPELSPYYFFLVILPWKAVIVKFLAH